MIQQTEWIVGHKAEDGSVEIEHLGGVPWSEAEIPHRLHRCRPQTKGWINYFTFVARCRCGGISYDGRRFICRNSRTRES